MKPNWRSLGSVAFGTFMATLDSSIVNVALPVLTVDLQATLDSAKWTVLVYFLLVTCLLLPLGRLSDQFGRKRAFLAGFAIFTLGSLLCSLSTSLGLLVAARSIQAIGAATLMANGPAIIVASFPLNQLGKALGTMAMVVSVGLISGPVIGGFLIHHFGWRSIFLINVPIGLVGYFFSIRHIVTDTPHHKSAPFDWLGAILQVLFILALVLSIDPPAIVQRSAAVCAAIVFFAAFLVFELMSKNPLMNIRLFKNQVFWSANLAALLVFMAYMSVAVLMPFYLEKILTLSTDRVGMLLSIVPLVIFVVAPISGRLADRYGTSILSILGTSTLTITLASIAGIIGNGLTEALPVSYLALYLVGIGTGMGLFQSPNNTALMSVVPKDDLSSASALLATIRNLGFVAGVSLSMSVFVWKHSRSADLIQSFKAAFVTASVLAAVAVVVSIGKARKQWRGNQKKGN